MGQSVRRQKEKVVETTMNDERHNVLLVLRTTLARKCAVTTFSTDCTTTIVFLQDKFRH